MTKGAISSTVTGLLIGAGLIISGVVFFFSLLIMLNGFMGQERAVNGSFITYIALTVITGLLCTGLGAWLAYYLTARRGLHAVASTAIGTVIPLVVGVGLHFASVIIAVIVADQLRTRR